MALDAYHRWLGISPKEQPPNHYRLLSIELFEDNPDVIEAAADRQMGHLRTYQSGKHSELSQKLLNEVAAAKVCLLNPEKKAAYDRGLHEQLKAKRKVIPNANPPETSEVSKTSEVSPQQPVDSGLSRLFEKTSAGADIAAAQVARGRRQTRIGAGVGIGLVGLVAAVGLILWALRPSDRTMVVLDWPEQQRRDAVLQIDDDRFEVRPAGELVYPLSPGKHRLTAVRPDYEPYQEQFTLPEGKRLVLQPQWTKRSEGAGEPWPRPGAGKVTPKPPETKGDAEPAVETHHSPQPETPAKPPVAEKVPEAETPKPQVAQKLPVPAEEERGKVAAQLTELFELSKDRKPSEQRALAKEMIELAGKSSKPAERYVLLQTAAALACQGGDVAGMLQTVDKLAAAFEVDALSEKRALVASLAKSAKDSASIAALLAASDKVVEEALAQQKYDLALELAEEAYKVCAQSAGRDHRKRAFDRRKEVQALAASWRQVQAIFEKLKAAPDDPEANLAAGRYYCFDRGDWQKGLVHLAKSGDAELQKLAKQETESPPSEPGAMLKLADAWWSLSEAREGPQRDALMLRAGTWYREAQPEITSTLLKAKVDKRLADIAKLDRPIPEPSFQGPPAAAAIAPLDQSQAKRLQKRWAEYLGVPVEKASSIGMKLVLIPPGEFDMGSSKAEIDQLLQEARKSNGPEPYIQRLAAEGPQHHVRISKPLYLGSHEVTVGQFRQFVAETGYQTEGEKGGDGEAWRTLPVDQTEQCPVVRVTWNDVAAFCQWVTRKEGQTCRLPTEAEWEYACRAGSTTQYHFGNDSKGLGDYAWWRSNADRRPHPVGQKRPNSWGLYDVHGNVWEWCADWAAPDYYRQSPSDDPAGPPSGGKRALRGGSCGLAYPGFFRSAVRGWDRASTRPYDYGFRVVCEVPARAAAMPSARPTGSTPAHPPHPGTDG